LAVKQGIDSISLNPDVAIKTQLVIANEEKLLGSEPPVETELRLVAIGTSPGTSIAR